MARKCFCLPRVGSVDYLDVYTPEPKPLPVFRWELEESSPLPPRSPGDSPNLNLDHSPIRRSSSFHTPSVTCTKEKLQDDHHLQPDVSGNSSLFQKDKKHPKCVIHLKSKHQVRRKSRQGLKYLSGSAPSVTCAPSIFPGPGLPLTPSTCQSRQKKFLRHFDVHPDERVIDYFSCALVADILLQGHLYISKNYFAFYSNVFGYVTKLLIPVSTVTSLTKEKTAFILPNAVAVVTADDRHVFSSLLSRDTTYRLMVQVWREAQPVVDSTGPAITTNKVRCRSALSQRARLAEPDEVSLSDKSISCSEPTLRTKISSEKPPSAHLKQPVLETEKAVAASRVPKSTLLLAASTLLLVLLFISAAVLMYRLSSLHQQFTTISPSASQRSLLEVQEYLEANLKKLHKVRQSLEVLSLLMEDEKEHLPSPGNAQKDSFVLPDSSIMKSENNNQIDDYTS
ncbi:GRAM domain-containing protein 2B-like [Macrosteles quadrilineatus]|uniref:GRAM domain-containing protein 2B-like n=1 Tax=Macrosteles quadrilineatus TaxID=74068 RepID=UPI0023E167FC|nr:GRAM domain-containing protein 2B-like [Macrosteles quadrilineatus]